MVDISVLGFRVPRLEIIRINSEFGVQFVAAMRLLLARVRSDVSSFDQTDRTRD